jgi:hypothetical protein
MCIMNKEDNLLEKINFLIIFQKEAIIFPLFYIR